MNIPEIEMDLSDLVNEDFDPSEFAFKFIEIFNAPKATLDNLFQGNFAFLTCTHQHKGRSDP